MQAHGSVLMVVDQPNTIGALPIAVARDCGCTVGDLPDLAMRKAADLYPGRSKTDGRDAFIIADTARTMPHTLRAVDRDDETLAALKMLAGFHDDIAKDATRTKNRLRSVLTQIHPALERVVAGEILSRTLVLDSLIHYETEMGCLQSQGQFDIVKSMVDEAIESGATVLTGGRPRPDLGPLFYEPTVLTDVPEGVALLTKEVFGPVVVLQRVSDVHEAIAKSNDSRYGLNASLWTSPRRAKELAPQLEAGTVNVNDGFAAAFASVDAPMGGFKDSGVGRRQAAGGLLKYTDEQTVTVQRLSPVSMPQMPRELYSKVFNTALVLGKKFNVLP